MTPTIAPPKPSPAPRAYERRCRHCGCTEKDACVDPTTRRRCSWSTPDVCTTCQCIIADFLEFLEATHAGRRQVRAMVEELLAENRRLKK